MLRFLVVLLVVVALIATADAGTAGVAEQSPSNAQGTVADPAVFITLPMTSGFADATDALVETQGFVRDALNAVETVRLVERLQDSDAILTVLGRGTGYVELTAALQAIGSNVGGPPVMRDAYERCIEVMVTVGTCGEAAMNATIERKAASCYRKIFVGLGDDDVRKDVPKAAQNSWTTCSNALVRDVQAGVTQHARRPLACRGHPR